MDLFGLIRPFGPIGLLSPISTITNMEVQGEGMEVEEEFVKNKFSLI